MGANPHKAKNLFKTARKALIEAINTSTRIGFLLFARVKWVANRTNVDMDSLRKSRTGFNNIATTTGRDHFPVFGMNVFFHKFKLALEVPPLDLLSSTVTQQNKGDNVIRKRL